MAGLFTDIASTVLSKTLDATSARQKAIANNIANVETPGYKRRYVSFEKRLEAVLARGQRHDIKQGLSELVPVSGTDVASPSKSDGNNVNIDAEIAEMTRTVLEQRAATVLLEGKGAMLRAAIKEGK